jgi:hypothetical protein
MADEKLRKMAEDALSRLSAELEARHSDAMKNYLSAMSRFHRYSWGNVLLIASQNPSATFSSDICASLELWSVS